MIATIELDGKLFKIDFSKPIDISIPLQGGEENVGAWYLEAPKIKPVVNGDWIGSVKEGGDVNFNNIFFNPHSHCTHTETVGHISKDLYPIHQNLKQYFFYAQVISITPEKRDDDWVITRNILEQKMEKGIEAIVLRTLPNSDKKKSLKYSHSNPPYLLEEAAIYLREQGVKHLLIDLPSVDKEKDNGELLAHNAFWNTPKNIRIDATITEFIYVPSSVKDGLFCLNLMVAPFVNDAAPSKPVLYKLM